MYICNMRKYFVFAAAALVALSACNKNGREPGGNTVDNQVTTMPAWMVDETLPVPIQMGEQGVLETKGAAIADLDGLVYNVIALRESDNEVMAGFSGGVRARNIPGSPDSATGDNLTGQTVVQFLDSDGTTPVTKYYPYLYSDGTFNFYGYRIGADAPSLSGTSINVELGDNDLLWAKAEALASDETAARAGNTSVGRDYESNGFSARYIRGIRREYVTNNGSMENYIAALPHLNFQHITSQLQFFIKAFDTIAENTLNAVGASVSVASITIGGTDTEYPTASPIAKTANLNILNGELTQVTSGTLSVSNIADDFSITEDGAVCGDPLFIRPFTGNILLNMALTLPDGTNQTIKTVLEAPAIAESGTPGQPGYHPAVQAGRFEANYVYKFTISLESIEKINIVTTLSPWGPVIEPAAPTVID